MNSKSLNRESILAELRQLKPELAKRFGVSSLGLFGSFVRNEAHSESDIDVVVEMLEPDMFTLVHIKETLENDFQRPVDIIRYRSSMNQYLKARIEREAVYV